MNNPMTVLLIEDNPGDARLIQAQLASVNGRSFNLEWHSRLSAGLERLAQGGLAAVVLDLHLPDSDGLETLRRVMAQAPGVPILVLTGLDDEAMASAAVHAGAQDYLIKGKADAVVPNAVVPNAVVPNAGDLLARSLRYAVERQRIDEMLRQRTLELQARNEELDAFAHTVAHDLKNPVCEIMGYAEFLQLDPATLTGDQRQCVNGILRVIGKMNNIIDALLLLSQVRTADVVSQPLDMPCIVAEAQRRLRHIIQVQAADLCIVDASNQETSVTAWPAARGYAAWVEEVWVNYMSNALKYGGRPPRIELGAARQANDTVRFWVRDNGPGIAPAHQAQLFAPFVRLDQTRADGHGLGLSIVRRIMDKLGGQVGVESQPGQGATFYFTLPAQAGNRGPGQTD